MLAFNAQTLTVPSAKAHLAAPLPSRHPLPVATSPHLVPSHPLPVALCPAPHPPRLPLCLPPQFGAAAPGAMSVGGNAASMAAAAQKLAASMSGVTGAKAPEPTRAHYEAELEINDFPQHARWKVRGEWGLFVAMCVAVCMLETERAGSWHPATWCHLAVPLLLLASAFARLPFSSCL